MNWLFLPIEIQKRELSTRCLIASLALHRNFRVLVGQDRSFRRLIKYLPKAVVLENSIGRKGDRKVKMYARNKFTLTALDEETTGYFGNPDVFTRIRLAEETLECTKRWFSISKMVTSDICERFPNHTDKFVTTGLPRTDIWRNEFRDIYKNKVEHIHSRFGKFILFNSNFASTVHAFGQDFIERQTNRNAAFSENFHEFMSSMMAEEHANLEIYLKTLPRLLKWFPDHKLIVRPHPSDDINFWKTAFADYPQIEVILEGNVTPWILASDCLIHHGCTTGIEAELMGKPHVMFAPEPDQYHESEAMKDFATIVRTEGKLESFITDILAGNHQKYAKDRNQLEKHYASLTGKLASEKILDELDKIAFESGPLPKWLWWMRFLPRQLVAEYWPRSRRAIAYSRQKWEGTSVDELTDLISRINSVLGFTKPFVVREVYPDLFEIFRETHTQVR